MFRHGHCKKHDEYKESRKKCPYICGWDVSTSCTCEEGTTRLSVVEGCDGSASAKGGLCYTHAKNKNEAAGVAGCNGATEEEGEGIDLLI